MHKEAWQHVYVGIRHMHREHFIFSNPTCALRAPLVEQPVQPCFYLCRGNAGVAQNPGDTTETSLTFSRSNHDEHNAYMCHDTGIPERRIFRLLFLLFVFLRFVPIFYEHFDATMQKFLVSLCQDTAHTSVLECLVVPLTPFLGRGSVALVCDFELGPIKDDF